MWKGISNTHSILVTSQASWSHFARSCIYTSEYEGLIICISRIVGDAAAFWKTKSILVLQSPKKHPHVILCRYSFEPQLTANSQYEAIPCFWGGQSEQRHRKTISQYIYIYIILMLRKNTLAAGVSTSLLHDSCQSHPYRTVLRKSTLRRTGRTATLSDQVDLETLSKT